MKKTKHILLLGIVLIFGILPLIDNDPYFLQIIIMTMFFAFLGQSWNIVGGFAGQLSLGHSAFIGIGAYVTTVLFIKYGLSPWVGTILGGLISGVLGVAIGYPCFRLRGTYYTLATIAFLYILQIIITTNNTIFGFSIRGAAGLAIPWKGTNVFNMQFSSKTPYYYIILLLLIVITVLAFFIKKSKIGFYLAAINTNQEAAASLGVNIAKYKMFSQFISVFFTAIGGTFYAMFIQYIDPLRVMGFQLSFEIVLLVIIGGQGTILGPILGAFILEPISQLTQSFLGGKYAAVPGIIYGLVLMVIIYFLPDGILKYFSRYFKIGKSAK